MRTFLFAAGVWTLSGCSTGHRFGIGSEYPPYPSHIVSESGTLVQDTVGGPDYPIEQFRDAAGDVLWLGRFVRRRPNGAAIFRLTDTLRLPPVDRTRFLVTGDCTLGGTPKLELLALVRVEDVDTFRTIYSVWRVDRRTGRFVSLPSTAGVTCANAGWGTP